MDICAQILFLLIIFSVDILRKIDRIKLKQGQGRTHCRRGLITDPIAHVVTDVDLE